MFRRLTAVLIVVLALGAGATSAWAQEDTGDYPPTTPGPTVLPTVIENTTVVEAAPTTPPPTVQGRQEARQLGRTGADIWTQVFVGFVLVGLGSAIVVSVRRRRDAAPEPA